MAVPRQVKHISMSPPQSGMHKENCAQKAVAIWPPTQLWAVMRVVQPGLARDAGHVDNSAVGAALAIGLLQRQNVRFERHNGRLDGPKGPGRVFQTVFALCTVNVPRHAA